MKSRRHYAGNGVPLAVELYLPVQNVGIAGKMRLPQSKAEDENVVRARFVFATRPGAAQQRTRVQQREEIALGVRNLDVLRSSSIAQVHARIRGIERHVGKALGL